MARHHCSESGDVLIPMELDGDLLHGARACLRRGQSRRAPSEDEKQVFQRFYDLDTRTPTLIRVFLALAASGNYVANERTKPLCLGVRVLYSFARITFTGAPGMG